jgi:hypothetical protein
MAASAHRVKGVINTWRIIMPTVFWKFSSKSPRDFVGVQLLWPLYRGHQLTASPWHRPHLSQGAARDRTGAACQLPPLFMGKQKISAMADWWDLTKKSQKIPSNSWSRQFKLSDSTISLVSCKMWVRQDLTGRLYRVLTMVYNTKSRKPVLMRT